MTRGLTTADTVLLRTRRDVARLHAALRVAAPFALLFLTGLIVPLVEWHAREGRAGLDGGSLTVGLGLGECLVDADLLHGCAPVGEPIGQYKTFHLGIDGARLVLVFSPPLVN